MFNFRMAALAIGLSASIISLSTATTMAESLDPAVATVPSKAAAKARRKADRKAAQTRKNTELRDLEKNGYQPGGDQLNYPQNLQDAERKSAASKAKAASAQ